MGNLLSRPPSHPPSQTPEEELSTLLFTFSSRLFFSIRRTKSFQKRLQSLHLALNNPTALQKLVYNKLQHGAGVLLHQQCAQREWIETQRQWLRAWIEDRRRQDRAREYWWRKEAELERNAPLGKRARGHVREGAEADGVRPREKGERVRHRGANVFPAGGVVAYLDQAIKAGRTPVTQNPDPDFGIGRNDDEHVGGDSGDRNDSWDSSSIGETDLWCLVGEEAIVVEDAEEACAWHDEPATAEPTSKTDFAEEDWTWEPDSEREEVGAWDNDSTVTSATPDTWISEPDYNQQKEATWDDSRTVIPGSWDDSRTVIPDVADTWGCKPEQLHEIGAWDDGGTPDTAVVQKHVHTEWYCTCLHCTQNTQNRRCKDSDINQKEGLRKDGVYEHEPILEEITTWVLAKTEEDAGKNKPCTCWDCDEDSGCWVHGSEEQERSFEGSIIWDEAASVDHTIVTTNTAEQDSWGSQNAGVNGWSYTANDSKSMASDWSRTSSNRSATASDWSRNWKTEQLERAPVNNSGWDESVTDDDAAHSWNSTANDWSCAGNDWHPAWSDESAKASDWSCDMRTEQQEGASTDTVEGDEPVTDDDAADSWRCTDFSWTWSEWLEKLSGSDRPCSPSLTPCASNDSSWRFECKQQKANAWSEIDETGSAAEIAYVCGQDMDAKVDLATVPTEEASEADYSYLTDTESEKAAGDDLLSFEMESDDSDDGCLWDEVSDCDTVIHTDPNGEEGWDTVRDFEVSTNSDLDS